MELRICSLNYCGLKGEIENYIKYARQWNYCSFIKYDNFFNHEL